MHTFTILDENAAGMSPFDVSQTSTNESDFTTTAKPAIDRSEFADNYNFNIIVGVMGLLMAIVLLVAITLFVLVLILLVKQRKSSTPDCDGKGLPLIKMIKFWCCILLSVSGVNLLQKESHIVIKASNSDDGRSWT